MGDTVAPPEELQVLDDALRRCVRVLINQDNDAVEISRVLSIHLLHRVADIVKEETA